MKQAEAYVRQMGACTRGELQSLLGIDKPAAEACFFELAAQHRVRIVSPFHSFGLYAVDSEVKPPFTVWKLRSQSLEQRPDIWNRLPREKSKRPSPLRTALVDSLVAHPEGLTISQAMDILSASRDEVRRHLMDLLEAGEVSRTKIHRRERGRPTYLWKWRSDDEIADDVPAPGVEDEDWHSVVEIIDY